jgi:hypothetical protein
MLFRIMHMQELAKQNDSDRAGPGRPSSSDPKKSHTLRFTESQWAEFKRQGGNAWLSALLDLSAKINSEKVKKCVDG